MKTVAIVQSNYIPWKGYFDLIAAVDLFLLLDDVQYTRRDWRNRNKIKTPRGMQWLTVPVEVKGKFHQLIRDVVVSEPDWARKHWRMWQQNCARAPHFKEYAALVEGWYEAAGGLTKLTEVNELFLRGLCGVLGIATPIRRSSEFTLSDGKTERLLGLCVEAGASTYLSGPAARGYLDVAAFTQAGITVEWMNYDGYREYPQLFPPFEHGVSVLDLLFNTGPEAPRHLKHAGRGAKANG